MKSLQERTEQSMAKNLKVGMLVCASILAANAAYANYPSSNELLTVTQQTGKIKGTIVDSKTGEPVIGASVKVTMFANANAMTTVGRRSLEALRLQPLGKPPQCFS